MASTPTSSRTAPGSRSCATAAWPGGATFSTRTLEDAGQHEFLNWISLAGAMHELGQRAEIVDHVESYVFNSDKCFAIFRLRG